MDKELLKKLKESKDFVIVFSNKETGSSHIEATSKDPQIIIGLIRGLDQVSARLWDHLNKCAESSNNNKMVS